MKTEKEMPEEIMKEEAIEEDKKEFKDKNKENFK